MCAGGSQGAFCMGCFPISQIWRIGWISVVRFLLSVVTLTATPVCLDQAYATPTPPLQRGTTNNPSNLPQPIHPPTPSNTTQKKEKKQNQPTNIPTLSP